MRHTRPLLPAVLLCAPAFLAAAPPAASVKGSARTFSVLIQGNPAGTATERDAGGGRYVETFEFNDRGRGPKLSAAIVLAPDGVPVSIDTAGNDYLKARVDDHFAVEAGRATWSNAAERGSSPAAASFFVSYNGVPQEMGMLARALLRAPERRLALLPAGRARLERGEQREIAQGTARRTVTLYGISGLSFTPVYVWLDSDGGFFGAVDDWSAVLPTGWEGVRRELLAAQDRAQGAWSRGLAARLARRPAGPLVFEHARLFDSVSAAERVGMTVVMEGRVIRAVGPDGTVAIPPGAEGIDAAGKTLLPGLWDMHVHLTGVDGLLDIANGITTVRDLGNDPDRLLPMRSRFDDGTEIGPRVIPALLVDGRGPYSGPTRQKVDSVEEGRRLIDEFHPKGYVQLKIYSSIRPDLVAPLARYAHERGMRVSGHVPAFMTAEQFVRDGADEIQHENFLFLNFLFDRVKDTRTPARFTAVAEYGASITPDRPDVARFLDFLKSRGTVIDPTLNAFESLFTDRPGRVSNVYAEVADRFPPQVRRGFLAGGLPVPEGKDALYRESFRSMLRMARALYDRGIPIVAGTDALAGFTLVRELELYAEAGIPPAKVLQIATLGGARVMKRDRELGSIEPGKLADCILVEGDPVARLADLRRVALVVRNGTVYDPARIDRAIGVEPSR